MIQGRDIIIFGDDWGHYVSTIQHIGKILSEQNRIIWIGSIGLRKPGFSLYDIKRIFGKLSKMITTSKTSVQSVKNIHQIFPLIVPFHDSESVYRYNMRNIRDSVMEEIKKENVNDPIILSACPIIGELVGTLGERSSYYICLDDWTKFDGAFDSIGLREQELLRKVTGVFSISEPLLHSRVPKSGNNFLLPQGVEIEHFIVTDEASIPLDCNDQKPIVGFFGILSSWVDIDLIAYCAERLPEFSFVVIGKQNTDISKFSQHPNISYIGEVPYADLPRYAKSFNAGLIPFKVNALTIASNPIKLLEYLSLGIPVVSTNLPEVKRHNDIVYVAETNDEFVSFVKQAIEEQSAQKSEERKMRARKYSWRSVTETLSDRILTWEQESRA